MLYIIKKNFASSFKMHIFALVNRKQWFTERKRIFA